MRQDRLGDRGVVVDHLTLGEPGLGIEDLVEVRQRQPPAFDLDRLLLGAMAGTVPARPPQTRWYGHHGHVQSIWRGTISFGLVSIPVRLYSATEEKSISFRQVHEADAGRIRYKRVCSVDGEEVPYSDIAKGYELPDGDMVVLTDEDFEQLPLKSTRTVDVLQFVPVEDVDPVSFDRAYLCDASGGDAKPYVLLRDALERTGKAAIVKVALRQRERLAMLRPARWRARAADAAVAGRDPRRPVRLPGRGHQDPAAGGRHGRVVHRRPVGRPRAGRIRR